MASQNIKIIDKNTWLNKLSIISVGIIIFAGLYWAKLYNYLLFHSLAEIFSIIIAISIFIIAWNTRKFSSSCFLSFLGVSALFIGIFDFIHLLAYEGMNLFYGFNANLPTQLWIAARYLQAISFLIALIFIKRKLKIKSVLAAYTVISILLLLSIFYWRIFPTCYIEGAGLTVFKKTSEYIISFLFLLFVIFLLYLRKYFNKKTFHWMIIAGISSIISEIAFTFYVGVFDLSNMVGHFFKIIAFYALYRALIKNILNDFQSTIFKNLQDRKMHLENMNKELLAEKEKTDIAIAKAQKSKEELEKELQYSEQLNKLMIGRELQMIKLKEEIADLKKLKNKKLENTSL